MSLSSILFYTLMIICDIVGICTTIVFFSLLWFHRSIVKTDRTSYLLIANSYIAFIVAFPLFMDIALRSIYGQMYPESDFSGWSCLLKSYLSQMTGCTYFYSFLLQAIYRFFRIVYPNQTGYQSFYVYVILSISNWIIAAVVIAPTFALGFLQYLPTEYHCQYPLTDFKASTIGLSGLFIIPFTVTLSIYFVTLCHVRRKTKALIMLQHKMNIQRDLLILTHLVILFIFVSTVGMPHLIFTIIHQVTGRLPSWAVACTWFFTLFSFSMASIIQLFSSSHLRKLWMNQHGTLTVIRERCFLEVALDS